MFLSTLSLKNFRNYQKSDFKFVQQTTLFVGPNTSGKTNLLEAIYLLSHGKSFRQGKESDCLKWGKEISNIILRFHSGQACQVSDGIDLEVLLTAGEVNGIKAPLKKYLVNGVSKRQIDFVGNLRCVLFRPEDLELITDSPSTRRNFLDSVLTILDRDYQRSLLAYEKGLRQRNRLLDFIREGKASPHQLYFWNKLLIRNGNIVTNKRQEFIDFLNLHIDIFADLEIEYDLSAISEERLTKYKNEELAAGATLVGPHRDNFIVYQKKENQKRDIHSFGSRGEQRLAVLSLKLCEIDFIEEKTQDRPVLLLDDVFSELDSQNRDLVLKAIPNQQTIITTTDIHFVEDFLDKMEIKKL